MYCQIYTRAKFFRQKNILQKAKYIDMVPFEFSETFIDGFRLGARMMIEVFQNDLHIR